MSATRKDRGAAGRLEALLAQGDHAAARAEARRQLAEAGGEAAGGRAAEVLASLQPEPGAVRVGLLAVALAAAVVTGLLR